jgi:CpeT protein
MRRTILVSLSLILSISLFACIQRKEVKPSQAHLDRLVTWMTGSFSSQEQSQLDTAFFDIRLQMVQIWPERTDGRWLYVEQASALTLDRPYRQRIYRLFRRNDTTLVSAVYEIAEPLRLAGAWRTPTFSFPIRSRRCPAAPSSCIREETPLLWAARSTENV